MPVAGLEQTGKVTALPHSSRSSLMCRIVQAARYQEDYRGMAMWVALCNDGRHWAIFIAPNGDTQVSNCADARRLRLPQCRPVMPMPADPNTNQIGNGS